MLHSLLFTFKKYKNMKRQTKVYTLKRFGSAALTTEYMGQEIRLEFSYGHGAIGCNRGTLIVNDKFTQDAIEHDSRFGSLITLTKTIEHDEDAEEVEPKDAKPDVQVVRAKRYTQAQLDAMKEGEKSEEAPKAKTKSKKAKAKEDDTTIVDSVSNLNDAYDYFAEQGMNIESKEQLEEAMASKKVAFPNLEL